MHYRIVLVAGAALALGACSKSATTEGMATPSAKASAPAASEAPAASAATPAAAAVAGSVPDKAYMVGRWTEDASDCRHMVVQFDADGTMKGPFEKWELDDGVLAMVGQSAEDAPDRDRSRHDRVAARRHGRTAENPSLQIGRQPRSLPMLLSARPDVRCA